jgi:hypothetical protein
VIVFEAVIVQQAPLTSALSLARHSPEIKHTAKGGEHYRSHDQQALLLTDDSLLLTLLLLQGLLLLLPSSLGSRLDSNGHVDDIGDGR